MSSGVMRTVRVLRGIKARLVFPAVFAGRMGFWHMLVRMVRSLFACKVMRLVRTVRHAEELQLIAPRSACAPQTLGI